VEISFIGQPFPGVSQIGSVVQAALEEGANTSAWFATAWGKRSGLGRLAPSLERFRAEGGKAEIVLGIDEAGATAEGLLLASELFDSAWIFHDPGPRTFHPKMYAVQSDLKATVVIGSGNLTKGGLFTNYEIATAAGLDLGVPGEASFLADARAYFEQLIGSKSCRPLTAELIEELRSDPRVLLRGGLQQGPGKGSYGEEVRQLRLWHQSVGWTAGGAPARAEGARRRATRRCR
jgi:hypothetical protein